MKIKKGFTLVEAASTIGVLSIIISTLLLLYYNIFKNQQEMIISNTFEKQAEYYILKEISNGNNPSILDIKTRLQKDFEDLKISDIQINENSITIYSNSTSKIEKRTVKIEIKYNIKSRIIENKVETTIFEKQTISPPPGGSGGGSGGSGGSGGGTTPPRPTTYRSAGI